MLPSYVDYIFVHPRQKVRLRPKISPNFLSTLGPNPTRKTWPDLQLWESAKEATPLSQVTNNLTLKCKRLNVFWISPVSKRAAEEAGQFDSFTGFQILVIYSLLKSF